MPSIMNGIDLLLKEYFDHFRGKKDLPPVIDELGLKGKIIPDQQLIDKWKRGEELDFIDKKSGIILYGKLDEALLLPDNSYVPFDYKTRGFPPTETHQAYFVQLSVYCLLIKKAGFKTKNIGYLAYFYPLRGIMDFDKESLPFKVAITEVTTDLKMAEDLFQKAIECLKGPLPKYEKECEFCQWILMDREL